jgi:hypothetical protein
MRYGVVRDPGGSTYKGYGDGGGGVNEVVHGMSFGQVIPFSDVGAWTNDVGASRE